MYGQKTHLPGEALRLCSRWILPNNLTDTHGVVRTLLHKQCSLMCRQMCTCFSSKSFFHHHSSLLKLSLFLLHLLQLSLDHLKTDICLKSNRLTKEKFGTWLYRTLKKAKLSSKEVIQYCVPGLFPEASSGGPTWALWSLFSCSCWAFLRAALWTRRVILASRSSSSSFGSPWNMLSFRSRHDGSLCWTRTPSTCVGHEDCLSEPWRGALSSRERFWNNTNHNMNPQQSVKQWPWGCRP